MIDSLCDVVDLSDLSDDIKTLSESEQIQFRKEINELLRNVRSSVKSEYCYCCGRKVDGFCNSHSVPKFCLKNIADNGEVATLNSLLKNPLMEKEKGVTKAGTFHLICRECDSSLFSDYENPDNYQKIPDQKMLAQIALKNSLVSVSKRLMEIELYNVLKNISDGYDDLLDEKIRISLMDLNEYEKNYRKAKKAVEKEFLSEYYLCFYEQLDYVVPIAFQSSLVLTHDFEGNIINDIYNQSAKYELKNINICIFPLKEKSVIMMFIENGDKRYRSFYKQFNKLSLKEKLSAITFIIFAYSEDIYFSKSIQKYIESNEYLIDAGKSGTDIISEIPIWDPLSIIKEKHDLSIRNDILNLLTKEYSLY